MSTNEQKQKFDCLSVTHVEVYPFFKGDDFRHLVNPMTRELREHIENCVLEKYQQAIG